MQAEKSGSGWGDIWPLHRDCIGLVACRSGLETPCLSLQAVAQFWGRDRWVGVIEDSAF